MTRHPLFFFSLCGFRSSRAFFRFYLIPLFSLILSPTIQIGLVLYQFSTPPSQSFDSGAWFALRSRFQGPLPVFDWRAPIFLRYIRPLKGPRP